MEVIFHRLFILLTVQVDVEHEGSQEINYAEKEENNNGNHDDEKEKGNHVTKIIFCSRTHSQVGRLAARGKWKLREAHRDLTHCGYFKLHGKQKKLRRSDRIPMYVKASLLNLKWNENRETSPQLRLNVKLSWKLNKRKEKKR